MDNWPVVTNNWQWSPGGKFVQFEQLKTNILYELKNVNYISASAVSSIKIWNMKTKTCIDTLIGRSGNVMSVMQFENGLMICGSSDKTI